MKEELNANNPEDYYNLVMKYVNSKEEYDNMFSKFHKNLVEGKLLDNEDYSKKLYSKIKDI